MLPSAGKSGLSSRSVHHLRAVVRNALNQAVRWDLIPRNPMLLTEPIRVRPRTEAVYLGPSEAPAILAGMADGGLLEPTVTLALGLGLREAEVLGLQWRDVDLAAAEAELHIRRQVQRMPRLVDDDGPRTELRIVPLRTTQSRRDLPLPGFIARALERHQTTITTTLAIYTHLTKNLYRDAAAALDRVFDRPVL
jgi:integrase